MNCIARKGHLDELVNMNEIDHMDRIENVQFTWITQNKKHDHGNDTSGVYHNDAIIHIIDET